MCVCVCLCVCIPVQDAADKMSPGLADGHGDKGKLVIALRANRHVANDLLQVKWQQRLDAVC